MFHRFVDSTRFNFCDSSIQGLVDSSPFFRYFFRDRRGHKGYFFRLFGISQKLMEQEEPESAGKSEESKIAVMPIRTINKKI